MGLIYRTQSLQETESPYTADWWFDLVKGLPGHESPEVAGKDVIAPGRQGRYLGNRRYDRHELLLEGFIKGSGDDRSERSQAWHDNSELILALFEMDLDPGELVAGPGTIDYLGLPGNFSIQVRTLDLMPGPILNRMSYQRWSVKLECVDGTWWAEGS